MKHQLIYFFAFAAICYSCNNADPKTYTEQKSSADSLNAPVLLFEKGSYNFGTIVQGEKVTYNFKFKNAGKSPLIITDAQSTCGCTVPEIPKEPIQPGQGAVIKVIFDSAGKMGKVEKRVTVTSNALKAYTEVYITGEITLPETNKTK